MRFIPISALLFALCALVSPGVALAVDDTATTQPGVVACSELPTGHISEDELEKLAPEGSNGRVRIAWKTESQENTYGFNILRADNEKGPYIALNEAVIPGEGTTNVPRGYCFEDVSVKRGETYYYQIEEVTTLGEKVVIEDTAATLVKVKTVEEEREWLKRRAAKAAEK